MPRPKLSHKVCSACGVDKLREAFGEKGGFVRDICKPCAADAARARRRADPEAHRLAKQATRKRNPGSHYAYNTAWAKTERGRLVGRVHQAVQRALKRGELFRSPTCEWCGRATGITAAHSDYSQPLDVKWLCRFCHARWDHDEPKTSRFLYGDGS